MTEPLGGLHSISGSVCTSHPADLSSDLGISKHEFDDAVLNRQHWLEEIKQWLENIDQPRLV